MVSKPTIDTGQMLAVVQESLRAAIAAAPWPRALADVVTDVLSEPARSLGGRLSPWAVLPLCSCAAVCGEWRRALPAATAAEIYITALDLFDDVEDGDASGPVEGHGIPVVLNAATALLALAHAVLQPPASPGSERSDSVLRAYRRAQDALWSGLATATGGQHIDLTTAGGPPLSVEECLDIARRKGGALTAACCRAGVSFGTDDPDLIARFDRFGTSLGVWGQLDNDMHDAGDGLTKSDLAQQKQTIPIAVARACAGAASLDEALWRGGMQLAYALVHAEHARAREALDEVSAACPDPVFAHATLSVLLQHGAMAPAPVEPAPVGVA